MSKDEYDLVVISITEIKEIGRWKYSRQIRESWPILKFNKNDSIALRMIESNLKVEVLTIKDNIMESVTMLDQSCDHIHLLDYE